MTPPEHQGQGIAEAPGDAPAVLSCADGTLTAVPPGPAAPPAITIATLCQRADFLRAAQARRQGAGGFLLQARDRGDGQPLLRIGFTASKKIGNAVARNRAKRRLRAVARDVLPRLGRAGWDYVLVARPGATVTRPYADLVGDLEGALRSIHRETGRERRS